MYLFACHDDRQLNSFSTNTRNVLDLDMITNGIVYEPLARSDEHLN